MCMQYSLYFHMCLYKFNLNFITLPQFKMICIQQKSCSRLQTFDLFFSLAMRVPTLPMLGYMHPAVSNQPLNLTGKHSCFSSYCVSSVWNVRIINCIFNLATFLVSYNFIINLGRFVHTLIYSILKCEGYVSITYNFLLDKLNYFNSAILMSLVTSYLCI